MSVYLEQPQKKTNVTSTTPGACRGCLRDQLELRGFLGTLVATMLASTDTSRASLVNELLDRLICRAMLATLQVKLSTVRLLCKADMRQKPSPPTICSC